MFGKLHQYGIVLRRNSMWNFCNNSNYSILVCYPVQHNDLIFYTDQNLVGCDQKQKNCLPLISTPTPHTFSVQVVQTYPQVPQISSSFLSDKEVVSTARCSRRSNGLGYIPSHPIPSHPSNI